MLRRILLLLVLLPATLRAGVNVNWSDLIETDASTNYLPVATNANDQAYTLTLSSDPICAGGVLGPCSPIAGSVVSPSGFMGFMIHESSGLLDLYDSLAPGATPPPLPSRRDIVQEPVSGNFWALAHMEEDVAPDYAGFWVLNPAGAILQQWQDSPSQSEELVKLCAGNGGTVYAAGEIGFGSLVVESYSAPGVLAWSQSVTLEASASYCLHDTGLCLASDGGVYAAISDGSTIWLSRFSPAGAVLWTASAPGGTCAGGTLGLTTDASGQPWVASGAANGTQCLLLKATTAGALSPVAQWSPEGASGYLDTALTLPSGDLLVGGSSGTEGYVADWSTTAGLQWEWTTSMGLQSAQAEDMVERPDGALYLTVYGVSGNSTNPYVVVQKTLMSLSLTASTATPTFTPTPGSGSAALESAAVQLYPNPFFPARGQVFHVNNVRAGSTMTFFDITGKFVFKRTLTGNPAVDVWDGRNANGIQVATGIYLLSLEGKLYRVAVVRN